MYEKSEALGLLGAAIINVDPQGKLQIAICEFGVKKADLCG